MNPTSRSAILCMLAWGVGTSAPAQTEALSLRLITPNSSQMAVGPDPEKGEGTLAWAADKRLSTASGSLAVRVRVKPQPTVLWASKVSKTERGAQTLAALTNTGGGEWYKVLVVTLPQATYLQ